MPGTQNYAVTIAVGGQTMQMTASAEVKKDGDVFVVTDTAKTPMGERVGRREARRDSLALLKRAVAQGPMSMSFEVKDGKATGEMKMGGRAEADDGRPRRALVRRRAGRLPGRRRAAARGRLHDELPQLRRPGAEGQDRAAAPSWAASSVTVPAGTFDSFKVELSADDGQKTTVWVAKDSHQPVKFSAVVPRMNGAVVTSELTK